MFTVVVPSLTRVTFMAWLLVPMSWPGKLRLLGEKEIALTSPTPVSAIVCVGLPGLLSLIVTAPVRVPAPAPGRTANTPKSKAHKAEIARRLSSWPAPIWRV
jgi:hypothetical protein